MTNVILSNATQNGCRDPTVVPSDNKSDVNANISNDHIPEPRCDQSSYITHETFYYYFIFSVRLCSYTLLYGNDPARAAIPVNLSMIYRFSSDTKTRATATRLFDYPTRVRLSTPCPVVIFTRPVAVIREIAFCRRSAGSGIANREHIQKATEWLPDKCIWYGF